MTVGMERGGGEGMFGRRHDFCTIFKPYFYTDPYSDPCPYAYACPCPYPYRAHIEPSFQ